MKRADNQSITRFVIGEWYIDIVEMKTKFEAWITHKDMGVSELMFGLPKSQRIKKEVFKTDFEEFCEFAEKNSRGYMGAYIQKYFDDAKSIL